MRKKRSNLITHTPHQRPDTLVPLVITPRVYMKPQSIVREQGVLGRYEGGKPAFTQLAFIRSLQLLPPRRGSPFSLPHQPTNTDTRCKSERLFGYRWFGRRVGECCALTDLVLVYGYRAKGEMKITHLYNAMKCILFA